MTTKIEIGAPAKRALNANERQVLKYLQQGMSPADICRKMRICFKSSWMYNVHDVPTLTYQSIICSIREKGWDITTDNKEDKQMAKGVIISEENKREIVQLAMAKTMTHKAIAEKFGVGKSTVWYLVDQYKKYGERAFEPTVTDEEPEIAYGDDADAPCYEVTADTDMEAYMADKVKKEPETAATETGSKQEIGVDIPADIIPEAEENVKPVISQVIPQAVIEACWGRKAELEDNISQMQAIIDNWEKQIAEIDDFLELAKLCNPMGGTI